MPYVAPRSATGEPARELEESATPHIEALVTPIRRIVDTGYVKFEQRSPRAAFTRKLERLCRRADEHPEVELDYPDALGRKHKARTRLKRLWVAGSYARGATYCGDLDLIVEHEVIRKDGAGWPGESLMCKSLLGALPDVRYYTGTPQENSSHVAMPEAVLLWSWPGRDWCGALTAIRTDPAAGPAPRRISVLPFRTEQLRGDEIPHLEDLVDARKRGLVAWEFIPFDAQLLAPIPEGVLTGELQEAALALRNAGAARGRLAPAILRLLHERYAGTGAVLHSEEAGTLEYGNTIVRFGSAWVRTACLSQHRRAILGCCDVAEFELDPHKFADLRLNDASGAGWKLLNAGLHAQDAAQAARHQHPRSVDRAAGEFRERRDSVRGAAPFPSRRDVGRHCPGRRRTAARGSPAGSAADAPARELGCDGANGMPVEGIL